MKDAWERFKCFYNGQDRIDRMNREFDMRMEWHREEIELARKWHQEDFERARKQARVELRDRFAMAVVSGVYLHWRTALDNDGLGVHFEDIAEMAYGVADAMLKARGDE